LIQTINVGLLVVTAVDVALLFRDMTTLSDGIGPMLQFAKLMISCPPRLSVCQSSAW